jgi:RNA polymerase sigma factor (sigma-70 family)
VTSGERPADMAADPPPTLHVVDPPSFEDVYDALYSRMVRVAHMLTGSNESAEDIVQDAFVGLYRRFDTVADPASYLYRSVVNGCGARHRHRAVVEKVRHLVAAPDAVDPTEVDVTRDALSRLAPRRRVVVVLRFYADLPLAEIAGVLRCSVGTVKSMLHRALRELNEAVER